MKMSKLRASRSFYKNWLENRNTMFFIQALDKLKSWETQSYDMAKKELQSFFDQLIKERETIDFEFIKEQVEFNYNLALYAGLDYQTSRLHKFKMFFDDMEK